MKILHVTDASAAGVLTSVSTLAREQVTLADVTFAYVRRPESPSDEAISEGMGPGVRTLVWHGPTREVALLRGLIRVLSAESFDVVHLHSSRAGFLGRIVGRTFRAPTVYSPHGFAYDRHDFTPVERMIYKALERVGLFFGRSLVLVSPSEEEVARAALPGVRTGVLTNAVDIGELDSMPAVTPSSTGTTIVHIGRIAPPKRPDLFSTVAARVRDALPGGDVHFRWIGEGDRSQLSPEIAVTGWLAHAAVLEQIATADLVLFTSHGEGLPMALAEAQGLGVPVVASSVTGVTDVVLDGETGVLAASEDSLTEAVLTLVRDSETRAGMAERGRAYVRSAFDSRRLGPESLRLYRALGASMTEEPVAIGAVKGDI